MPRTKPTVMQADDARGAQELHLLMTARSHGSTPPSCCTKRSTRSCTARRHLRRRHLRPRRPLACAAGAAAPRARLVAFDKDPEAVQAATTGAAHRRPALFDPPRQLRADARRARRARHRAPSRRAARPGRQLAADRRPGARLQLPLRRAAGHAHGHHPRRDRRGFSGPRRRAPDRGGDPRLWGRTVCCTDCKGACCSPRKRAPCSNHRRAGRSSWLVRSRPASRARTLHMRRPVPRMMQIKPASTSMMTMLPPRQELDDLCHHQADAGQRHRADHDAGRGGGDADGGHVAGAELRDRRAVPKPSRSARPCRPDGGRMRSVAAASSPRPPWRSRPRTRPSPATSPRPSGTRSAPRPGSK